MTRTSGFALVALQFFVVLGRGIVVPRQTSRERNFERASGL